MEDDPSYVIVKQFLNEIPQDLLAAVSTNCGAYSRALRHLEQYIKSTNDLQGQLDALQVNADICVTEKSCTDKKFVPFSLCESKNDVAFTCFCQAIMIL